MANGIRIPVEEYLRTSYRPDREYRDGVLLDRSMGTMSHAELLTALIQFLSNRRKQWKIHVYVSLRIRAREGWYAIPDLAVYSGPEPQSEIPEEMPFFWIEILAPEDGMKAVWDKARNVLACGTSYVWLIDPDTLESQVWVQGGRIQVNDRTLRLPDSPIVIPLVEAIAE